MTCPMDPKNKKSIAIICYGLPYAEKCNWINKMKEKGFIIISKEIVSQQLKVLHLGQEYLDTAFKNKTIFLALTNNDIIIYLDEPLESDIDNFLFNIEPAVSISLATRPPPRRLPALLLL